MRARAKPEFMPLTHVEIPREKGSQQREIGTKNLVSLFEPDIFFKLNRIVYLTRTAIHAQAETATRPKYPDINKELI